MADLKDRIGQTPITKKVKISRNISTLLESLRCLERQLLEPGAPDPLTNLGSMGGSGEVNSMLVSLIDSLKSEGLTALVVSLRSGSHGGSLESTGVANSFLIDAWHLLRDIEKKRLAQDRLKRVRAEMAAQRKSD